MSENTFKTLYEYDYADLVVHAGKGQSWGYDYIPWSTAVRVVRELYPDMTYWVHDFVDALNQQQPYLETKFGVFVRVSVTIGERTETDTYAVEAKSQKDGITSQDIQNAHQRCLVKALARHGFALKMWEKLETQGSKGNVSLTSGMAQAAPVLPRSGAPSVQSMNSEKATTEQIREYWDIIKAKSQGNIYEEKALDRQMCNFLKVRTINDCTKVQLESALSRMAEKVEKKPSHG